MSTIQEKMEALRMQKSSYGTGNHNGSSGGTRKFHNASKSNHNKHPTLPRTTNKPNSYQQNSQVSLFSSSAQQSRKQDHPAAVTQLHTAANSSVSGVASNPHMMHSNFYKTSPLTSSHGVASSGRKDNNSNKDKDTKNPKLIPSLDPLQSCYGAKSRALQLKLEDCGDSSDNSSKPKGILSRPSSPCVTPSKKKRVTFNFNERTSSSSYVPAPYPSSSSSHNNHDVSSAPSVPAPPRSMVPTGRPMRPSLSEQLSAIADKASEVTADIRTKAGMDKENNNRFGEQPLLTSPAKNFTVGHLQCRYPAPVEFFSDRFEYKFHHPFQNTEIQLTIYYRDMNNASLTASPSPGKLIFRVPRHLVHFSADYDPAKHYVVLFLSSSADLQFIRKNIMPKIK
jgi:hypothetical protein